MPTTPDRSPGRLIEEAFDSFVEVTRVGGVVTSIIIWTDAGKTQKVEETNITRVSGQISAVETKVYSDAGALIDTQTETVTRASGRVASITVVAS